MNDFERSIDPKKALGIGIWSIDREFETCHKASLWLFNNWKFLFPGKGFYVYSEKIYLPLDVYHKLYDYLKKHVSIAIPYISLSGDDDYSRIILNLLEDTATKIYERCKRSINRPFPFALINK